jgi:SOS-response transcriptional repressor LexA
VLSERQKRILEFIYQYTRRNGYAPTMREIGEATETPSTSVVNYNLQHLVKRRYLLKTPGIARAYRLTRAALALVGEVPNDESSDLEELREEIKRLQNENEQLRRAHEAKMRALQQEYAHLVNEIYQLRHEQSRRSA